MLLKRWHSQFASAVTKSGMTSVDAYFQDLRGAFDDLLETMLTDSTESRGHMGEVSHFTQTKHRLTLPHLLEIFLSGEETLISFVCSAESKQHFSEPEMENAFELISSAFKKLSCHHVDRFCKSCVSPTNADPRRTIFEI